MNIKDFLIDNYIWIIVILLITIITIIGFLADKNSKNKPKKEDKNKQNEVPLANQAPILNNQNVNNMQYQPVVEPIQNPANNSVGMVYNENYQMPQQNLNVPNNGVINNVNTMNPMEMNQITPNNITIPTDANLMNSIQPVENLNQNIQEVQTIKPLSEQTPNIPPQPVLNFSNNVNNIPMRDTSIITPTPVQPVNNYNQQPAVGMDNNAYGMNNVTPMPKYNEPQTPLSPLPTPQPVNPQPIMQNPYNNVQAMAPTPNEMMAQPNTTPIEPQMNPQSQSTTPQPLNFVYGPQNNNQNM